VKVAAGAVAFLVWLGSVTMLPGSTAPIFVIGAPYQQILFAAAAAAFAWGTVQGASGVKAAYIASIGK
jgi:hypothetical protein